MCTYEHRLAIQKEDDELLASIIVPVYNVERYLSACLESLLAQTWDNIEIIVVDDGSTDGCGEICDLFAIQDSRIEVIHQDNHGLSAARNAGIKVAKGDILFFVDSDDKVEPYFCEKAILAMETYQADIVCFGTRVRNESGLFSKQWRFKGSSVISSQEAIRKIIRREMLQDIWSMAFRREVFIGLSFPEGFLSESTFISVQLLDRADIIATIPNITYNHLSPRIGSICYMAAQPNGSSKYMHDHYALRNLRNAFLKEHYPELLPETLEEEWTEIVGFSIMLACCPQYYDEEEVRRALEFLMSNRNKILASPKSPLHYRMWIILFVVSPVAAAKLYHLFRDVKKSWGTYRL